MYILVHIITFKRMIYVTVAVCESLIKLTDAAIDTHRVTVGSQVSLVCPHEKKFIDGKDQKHVECMPNGLWSEIISTCNGM